MKSEFFGASGVHGAWQRLVRRLGGLAGFAAHASAILGFVACSDSAPNSQEPIAKAQSALSGGTDPVVRYFLNESSGALASDSSGNGHSATLENGAAFVPGARGNAVRIAGGTQRVALPQGVLERCEDVTISARVKLATNNANWARIWDFGSSQNVNMFLTARAGSANVLRFAITNGGAASEQQVSFNYSFPTGTWKHVAVVLQGNLGTLYVDGAAVAQNSNISLNPADLGLTTQNWLGDSQYAADPTLDGTVDDVMVSCRAYSSQEIAWLAAGTDPVAKIPFDETGGLTAADTSGNARHATLANGASFVPGLHGNAVRIAGGTNRVTLPTGIVQACTDLTIGAHVRLATNASNWARIFDIGNSTTQYMFLSPRAGASNILRFAITTSGNAAEQRLSYTYSFPTATWKHVAVVLSGSTGTMYLDGQQVSQGTITLNPSQLGATINNFIGDSQFSADPTLDGTIDNLFVSCRALSPSEITTLSGACANTSCDDGNPCTTDTCSQGFCGHSALVDGTPCANGTVCDGDEVCSNRFCAAGTPPQVDDGNACTTDACDPVQGVTHTPTSGCGSGGTSGSGGTAGSGGSGATSGSGGSSGSAGATCPSGTIAAEMFIELPPGTSRANIALGSYGTPLDIHDRVRVLAPGGTTFSSVSSLTSIQANPTRLGVESHVHHFFAEPNLELRDRSRVHGNAVSPGTVTLFPDAAVDGQTLQQPLTPRRHESWIVCHPNTHQGNIDVQPGQVFPADSTRLALGAWGNVAVKSTARLRLRGAATYYFESLVVEPGGILDLDTAAGGIQLYFRTGALFRGVQERTDNRANVLFGSENGNFTINGSFRGFVVAPRGVVDLPTVSGGVHRGSFYGALVVAHQDMPITHEPVDTTGMCPAGTSNGLCPGDGGKTCFSDGDCRADLGLVCWLEGGRHFDKAGGTGVCAPPVCRTDPIFGGCGDLTQPCGRCEGTPRPCTANADCIAPEVCGTDNGAAFGLAPDGDFCWPPDCNTPATTPALCGTLDSACGICDCSANCAGRACGDSTDDQCGGYCAGLCDDGEPGCSSSLDCPSGSVCGLGIGSRFGHPVGTNACWPGDCADQDPAAPNGGVDATRCGVSPPCAPACEPGDTGPNGCGGFCGNCAGGEVRHEDGVCGPPVTFIHRSGVDLPEPFDPMPTNEVGATPGFFSVTDRGHASYSIGIRVPPGRLGIQPNLALRYLSTKADGMLGIGWSLTGLSTITRCRRILDRDGANVAIGFGAGDLFCLDGQALMKVGAGNYGDDGVEYRTEIDSFTKIVSHGSRLDPNGNYKGPDWFEVRTKDGRILTFGGSAFSKVTVGGGLLSRVWGLDRVEDHAGNYLDIAYRNHISVRVITNNQTGVTTTERIDTGELLPHAISYGGNLSDEAAGLPGSRHSRFVHFVYENRSDPTHHYVAGVQGYSKQRLTQVDISIGSELVKSYNLVYGLAFPPNQLAFVQECGKDAGDAQKCLPTTKLDYFEEEDIGPEREIRSIINPTPLVIVLQSANGLDRVLGWDYSQRWSLASPAVGGVRDGLPFFQAEPVLAANPFSNACIDQGSVLDLNRDGSDDLIDLCHPNAHIANANGFGVRAINVPDTFARKRVADVDGDGLKDLTWCIDENIDGYLYGRVSYARNTGTDFQTPVTLPLPTLPPDPACVPGPVGVSSLKVCGIAPCDRFLATDVDADGDDDLLFTATSLRQIVRSIRVPAGPGHVDVWESIGLQLPPPEYYRMLDFNGDGLKDFLSFDGTIFTIWTNTGEGFVQQRMEMSATTSKAPGGFDRAIVVDYDGDGREDLLLPPVWLRFAGPGRIEKREAVGLPRLLVDPADPVQPGRERAVLADFDGDGSQELVYDLGRKTAQLGRSGRARLLHTVTDGLGKRFAFQYDGIYDPPIDDRHPEPPSIRDWVRTYDPSACQASATTTCLRKVGPLVSSYSTSQVWNGPGGEQTEPGPTILYQYFGSRSGLRGRGSFGFSSRIVEGPITQTTHVYHNDDFVLAGRPQTITSVPFHPAPSPLGDEARFEETTFQWSVFQSGAQRPFPFQSHQTHSVYNGVAERAVVSRTEVVLAVPDEFGNETGRTLTTSTSEGVVDVTAVATAPIMNDPSTWIIGLPQARVITSTRGDTRYRFIDYQYDVGRRLLTGIVRNGGPLGASDPTQRRTTLFFPDAFGNINGTCVNDSMSAQRCTGVLTRDETNIFPRELRDAEGMTSEYIFAVEDGQLLAATDPNGNQSARGFDAFGRLQQVRSPTAEGTVAYSAATRSDSVFEDLVVDGAIAVTSAFVGEGPRASVLDAFGRLVKTESPGFDGAVVVHERDYDRIGRLVRSTVPHAPDNASEGLTRYEYDLVGRLSKITQPDGNATEYFYTNRQAVNGTHRPAFSDGDATLSLVKLPRGNIRLTVHDATGLVSETLEAADINRTGATATIFQRGPFGAVRKVLAPQGHTTYDVDDWGRTRSVIDPALGTRSFVYNGFDELVSEHDARLQVDHYVYDKLGRLVEKLGSDGDTIARWEFDGDPALNEQGRLVASWRRSVTGSDEGTWILNRYEGPKGLPSAAEYHVGATLADRNGGDVFATEYFYHDTVPGRLSEVAYPSNGGAFRVGYDYDAGSGAIRSVFPADAANSPFWTLTAADEGYRLGTEEFGNGVVSSRTYYDPAECLNQPGVSCAGRLKTITTELPGQAAGLAEHTWDSNGNLASLQRDHGLFYEYDSLDRLTREYVTGGPQNDLTVRSYAYNDAGDLTSKTGAGTYTYEPRGPVGTGSELRSVGSTTYWHDDNGNQTERIGSLAQGGYQQLHYNDFDMPHQIISGEGIGRTVTSLEYTSSGQRVRERTTTPGLGTITERVYVGDLYQRTENTLMPLAEHRYKVLVGSRQVAEVVRHGSDDDTDDVFYLHDDHLGSVTAITDADGGVAETRGYEPFGGSTSEGSATGVRSSFTGHDADTAVGLVNARGRLYDPKIGRFISADPFVTNPRSSQGWNRYAYVENNPLLFTDPSGFCYSNVQVNCDSSGNCNYDYAVDYACFAAEGAQRAAQAQAEAERAAQEAAGRAQAEADAAQARGQAEAQRAYEQAQQGFGQGQAGMQAGQPPPGYGQPTLGGPPPPGRGNELAAPPAVPVVAPFCIANPQVCAVAAATGPFILVAATGAALAVGAHAIWKAVADDDDDGVPHVDETGKFHQEEVPKAVPQDWSREEVETAIDQIGKSIRTRQDELKRLGEEGRHRDRIREEERFLRQLRKTLENRRFE